MAEDFSHLNEEQRLKAENEFLKMKMMLERGAQFGGDENNKLPADIENAFLNNIMAFEKQYEERKTIRVFDKIGKPQHFKPVNDIPDSGIDEAWKELSDYLNEYGIDLDVCSPNISTRELYRFTIEELFEHEMDDMGLPGWSTNFIYDEFHPDPVYDNRKAATDDCINYILQKEPLEWMHHFRKEDLCLNEHTSLTQEELKHLVNQFKMAYDVIEIKELLSDGCLVNEKDCSVTGVYAINAVAAGIDYPRSGNWKVSFELDDEFGYWYIVNVQIEGIKF